MSTPFISYTLSGDWIHLHERSWGVLLSCGYSWDEHTAYSGVYLFDVTAEQVLDALHAVTLSEVSVERTFGRTVRTHANVPSVHNTDPQAGEYMVSFAPGVSIYVAKPVWVYVEQGV